LIRACAYRFAVTLFSMPGRNDLLAVRFACSPAWETLAAVRTLVDDRSRAYHEPWHGIVQGRIAQLNLAPLLATQPLRGYVPDFLTPPPRVPWPRLRDQVAEIRQTPPRQVARELEHCRDTLRERSARRLLDRLLSDPERARDLLASQIHVAWLQLVAPFWIRVRTLLARDIDQRSRMLADRGLRHVLDQLDPRITWTKQGISIADRNDEVASVGERGLVLMPSAYLWPHVAAVVDPPWQPTIAYPARGIAELWRTPPPSSEALARLLGRTRALVLSSLDHPTSTTALAGMMELSPAGASRHLLALRDAGLVSTSRHGHEVRYRRTALGSALLRGAS
jgi:DNA-binding transcriptional ArsR family regulator